MESARCRAIRPDDDALAIDGKTLKGARATDGKQLLAALFHQQGTVLAQTGVMNKTNEIPTLKRLLEPLPIGDRVVTADALDTQQETGPIAPIRPTSPLQTHTVSQNPVIHPPKRLPKANPPEMRADPGS